MTFETDVSELTQEFVNSRDFAVTTLEPRITAGDSIHISGNFLPGYVFELVDRLVNSQQEVEGYLHLWLEIPFKFDSGSDAIALLVEFVDKNAETEEEAALFFENCLELIEYQILGLNISFPKTDPRKSPFSQAVVLYDDTSPEYWAYSDTFPIKPKKGIKCYRSWVEDEFLDARTTLQRLIDIADRRDSKLETYQGGDVIGWFRYASDWCQESDYLIAGVRGVRSADSDTSESIYDDSEDIESYVLGYSPEPVKKFDILERDNLEVYTEVKNYLLALPEFETENDYVYDDDEQVQIYDYIELCYEEHGEVDVDYSEFEDLHHLPPVYNAYERDELGEITAVCMCGERIIRRNGCHEIVW
jgi:hypothetical protein